MIYTIFISKFPTTFDLIASIAYDDIFCAQMVTIRQSLACWTSNPMETDEFILWAERFRIVGLIQITLNCGYNVLVTFIEKETLYVSDVFTIRILFSIYVREVDKMEDGEIDLISNFISERCPTFSGKGKNKPKRLDNLDELYESYCNLILEENKQRIKNDGWEAIQFPIRSIHIMRKVIEEIGAKKRTKFEMDFLCPHSDRNVKEEKSHDGFAGWNFAIHCLDYLFKNEQIFKKSKKIILFSDDGPKDFHYKEYLFLLSEIASNHKKEMEVNFFPEYHGCNGCDSAAGLVSTVITKLQIERKEEFNSGENIFNHLCKYQNEKDSLENHVIKFYNKISKREITVEKLPKKVKKWRQWKIISIGYFEMRELYLCGDKNTQKITRMK
ncbi:unnamed protein product [Didymodactylos carnosus]|uniref:Uncharacterized protein n=1 Tax=Didymodactylos carnosus TaxID=1234261 RepID=A0A8S2DS66_9BILA|nr:unnamed protein product [Didymodactylos carnosus]CAF3735443.1 unnamed protein product [Didymodactylos carnosus]